MMTPTNILHRRLHNQRLIGDPFATPDAAVRALVAVQSQDFPGAKWAIGQRTKDATDATLDRAYNDGAILRTHVLRPTSHFVLPDDIRWLLDLTAPRVRALLAYYDRNLEIDAAIRRRSAKLLAKALRDNHLTRTEISRLCAAAGIDASGQRLAHLVMHAELDAVICSGPLRGKQFTYALLDERAPNARVLACDDALAELTRRYFDAHGPAEPKDFAWWSGLTLADARRGVEMNASHLHSDTVDGKTYWFTNNEPPPAFRKPLVRLLPNYDDYLVGYRDNDLFMDRAKFPSVTNEDLSRHTVTLDGKIVGGWRTNNTSDAIAVRLNLFAALTKSQTAALQSQFAHFTRFLATKVLINAR